MRASVASVVLVLGLAPGLLLPCVASAKGGSREEKVRGDRARVEARGGWIYQDLPRAFEEARRAGKPLLVVLRCVPCEECVHLDDEVVDRDPRLRPLLDAFVRARVVSTNGLDLATFQFDTDQSWLAFLLRDDGTVYGRYGTRSHRTSWSDDVSVEGLSEAMEGALELHRAWPRDREALAGKRGSSPSVPSPERYPALAGRYGPAVDLEKAPVASCIHCHQVGEAERDLLRARHGRIPEEALFPFPNPRVVGLTLDPRRRATVLQVEPGSPAAAAGLAPGDVVRRLNGQPLVSIADVTWVLHRVPAAGGDVEVVVSRGGRDATSSLRLAGGWRRADDLSWRASTWDLRRRALGGLLFEPLPDAPGLRVAHVGQYAPHDVARRAGFRKGDVLESVDGRADLRRETDLLFFALTEPPPTAGRTFRMRRGGETVELALPVGRD